MIGKISPTRQLNFFETPLVNFINMEHELVRLAQKIDWKELEEELGTYFSENGRPAVPIRKMVGMLLLKNLYNLSDERVVERWVENPYYQYFTGEVVFQTRYPFDPSDFVHFRKRVGKEGAEKILSLSVRINGNESLKVKRVMVDTTVQEKNITFPTDAKLYKKVVTRCKKIASKEGITLRRSYTRELKTLSLSLRFMNHPKRKKEARKAQRRLRTIAKALVNELARKMTSEQRHAHKNMLMLMCRVVLQERNDKNKVYSLHEPSVACISKGKEAKPYEFGNKSSIAKTNTGIIVGAMAFEGNPYDGHTLPDQIEQIKRLTGIRPKSVCVDRGYRGQKEIDGTKIEIPTNGAKNQSYYKKQKERKKFRQRAGIEPVIGHLKSDHRMIRNYLKGPVGDGINTMLAAAAYNLRHWIIKYKREILLALLQIIQDISSLFSIFSEPHGCVLLQPILGNDENGGFIRVD